MTAFKSFTFSPSTKAKSSEVNQNFDDMVDQLTAMLGMVYPVGSVYFNATDATNPATLLGFGTWTAWGAGRVPVGFSSGETEFNVRQITDLLGIQLTTKKDSTPDGTVGLFGGFPDYTLHKHAGRLTANGWTVVVVDQIKDAKGVKVLRREIVRHLGLDLG